MKLFLPLFFILFFTGCSSPDETPVKIPMTNVKQEKVEILIEEIDSNQYYIDQIAKNYITNRNVETKLGLFGDNNLESHIVMYTNYGKLRFKLYKNTPLHRANFVLLAKKKFYDNTLFYRVINNFMIQGGNSDDEFLEAKLSEIGGYRIPNEINKKTFTKRELLQWQYHLRSKVLEKNQAQ